MTDTGKNTALSRTALTLCLIALFFVSPLLFFTDLTRNPYYLQITLLNAAVLLSCIVILAESVRARAWTLPPNILYIPLAALLAVMALSFARSYFGHAPFFRPSILSEFIRTAMFTAVNCVMVFVLAQKVPFDSVPARRSVYGWLAFALLWGALWFLFPELRTPAAGGGLMARFWDPYGGFIWAGGAVCVWYLVRGFTQEDFLHLAMTVGALASCYGALQYFRIELIWAKILNPYGNRSVSTFGNPNFISSYLVMLLPFALAYLMDAKKTSHRIFYGSVLVSYAAMLMASLTRSSWIGAVAATGFLFLFKEYRAKFLENKKFLGWFFGASLALLLLWPAQSLKPFSSGLAERMGESSGKMSSLSSYSLAAAPEKIYSSFHQRLLIWTCAWQMGAEAPMLGKGWGVFENFYPFYQGALIFNFENIRSLRTHANNAHNEVLEIFSQIGIIGFGVYIWLFAVLFAAFYRYYAAAAPDQRYWIVPFAAALIGMFADNMFNVSLHFAVPAMIFWWLLGAFSRKLSGPEAGSVSLWARPAAGSAAALLLMVFCTAGIWYWSAQFMREMHYFRGFKAMRRNDFASATADLKKAYDSHGREVNNNYELANAYVRSGDLDAARWAYLEALKSNAGYDEIYFNLAIVEKRLEKTASALDHLKVSAFINPLSAATYTALAGIYLDDASRYAREAADALAPAAKIFPTDTGILGALGHFYTLRKDHRAAREVYGLGVKANPGDEALVRNLTESSSRLGSADDPYLLWLRKFRRVQDFLAAGSFSPAAVAAADELVGLDPANLHSLSLRARISFKAGNFKKAENDLLAVLRANPADNGARYGLAVVYEKTGDMPAARREWTALLQAEPGNAAVAERLDNLPR